MPARWGISAAAGLSLAAAAVTAAAAGDYPLAGLTAFASENTLADDATAIKSEVEAMTGDFAKSGAPVADFAKTDACFFGFANAAADGTVVTYQLDLDAVEKAIVARQWPVPVAYKEVARTACVFDAATNAETCTDPDGSRFALVYFDAARMEFGFLDDPGKIAATRASPMMLRHDRIIDCKAFAAFLEGHVAPGKVEIRLDVRPLVVGYFVSRLNNDPAFAKAVEAAFAAKPPANAGAAAKK